MDPHDNELLDLVRPGLGHVDQDNVDQVDDRGSELRRMIASTAPSPERKRALRDLATWDRQTRFLEALETTPGVVHAAEAAGVSKRTVNDWRQRDTLGFLARMDGARESFADRLLALSWSLVQRLRPGQSPVLLLSLLNHYVPGFRPATAPEPMDARTTLAELRALSASTAPESASTVTDADRAIAQAQELLSVRRDPGPLGPVGPEPIDQGDDTGPAGTGPNAPIPSSDDGFRRPGGPG
tara:strand:+ start:199 stop:918 length:720 start_codon:yes stop_codon:yes gene_type:complete